jgi:hypothetical protein
MRKLYVWKLYDKDGVLLASGKHKEVVNVLYRRFVYGHIFDDMLYRTNEIYKGETR